MNLVLQTGAPIGAGFPGALQKQGAGGDVVTGYLNELLHSKLLPDLATLILSGKVFVASVAGANPAAYTGAAGGQPLIALHNPSNSGVNLIPLMTSIGVRSTGTVAAALDFNLWQGVATTAPTAAAASAYNQLSLNKTGGLTTFFSNAALTSQTGTMSLLATLLSIGNAGATAGLNVATGLIQLNGLGFTPPTGLLALGASATLTGGLVDASIIYAELPV